MCIRDRMVTVLLLLLVFPSRGADLMASLVHDQLAPCPASQGSREWSCVRVVPDSELAARHWSEYGFQPADRLDLCPACKRRKCNWLRYHVEIHEWYAELNQRQAIARRVTQGPGFLKMSIPPSLVAQLFQWRKNQSHHWEVPRDDGYTQGGYEHGRIIHGCYTNSHVFPVGHLELGRFDAVREQVIKHAHQVLEWWTGIRLVHSETFGMRIYHRNNMLINHLDRKETHVASVLLQVFQEGAQDDGWPLEIVGADGKLREIYLQPGEMLLYEGARFLHGRPMRFKGSNFGNIFSHFRPWPLLGTLSSEAEGSDDL
eukprot:TRINITY_DN55570_c0_g1_i1.p1 TRINITY_DN55570_c0_g1~~TRINITY_DN55570_c0_g1_i1.p1  ORF type:complete len:315 (-),score=68.89 TRINITY_DN55570_c0_g1_i1:230-1174(-)